MKSKFSLFFAITAIVFLLRFPAFGLDISVWSHDPSAIIKDGSKYYIFTTGKGIDAVYSTNLFSWTFKAKAVFDNDNWPCWIAGVVPGFDSTFWAPDCVYMNGKYYMYYSVSTFGSSTSAIGVATSPTLDLDSPSYNWTDQGMVVSSFSSSQVNAIDPAILKADGKVYLSYGSFFGGIGVIELDSTTGKTKNNVPLSVIAGGNGADWEAAYIVKEGSYYYLFVNRGACCQGINSTYKIVMGRSTSITGPYVDKNGTDLKNGGGTTMISSSDKYIGPGHFGLLRENGSNFVSMHYYDSTDNGNPKLDIANLGFDSNNWPFITRDWIAQGRYKITNQNSNKVWDSWGCTGASGEAIAQGTWADLLCQKWDFTPVGNGIYEIASAQSNRSADVINCDTANGAKLQLYDSLGNNCQKFKIERLADGSHILTSQTGTKRVVEVPGASLTAGTQLAILDYNNNSCQKWLIASAGSGARPSSSSLTSASSSLTPDESPETDGSYTVYPNPISEGSFKVAFQQLPQSAIYIEIFTSEGKLIHRNRYAAQQTLSVKVPLSAGVYLLKVNTGTNSGVKKLIFK